MSAKDCNGAVHAFRTFMQRAQEDIDRGGEIKPAVQRFDRADGRERITWRERAKALLEDRLRRRTA